MATTIEELRAVMRMELKPFMRDLQQMNGISAKAAKQVEQTWMQTNRRLDGIGKNMAQSLIAPLTGVGAALGARELIRLTDTWTDLNGRVRIAAGGMREGADVMERLSDMARRTYSSLETTAESYLTNSQALKELGYSTNQQLDFTEALNNALVVSGAKGQRAEQVINALGKAMAFGELRGENLNTVVQTGGRVAQALAEGLGVTTNELRKLGEAGKLKSSNVFAALTSQMQTLRDEADGMQATIGDAIQLLNNSFLEYVGGADQASGASARIAEAIITVADNMDTVANAALLAAQVIIGALAGRAMVGAGVQIVSTAKALSEFVRIARAAQGLGGLGPAFASLGANAGVIGLVVGGAAALALSHFANQAIEAEQRTDRFNAMLERMGIVAEESATKIDEAAEAQTRLSTAEGLAAVQRETEDATIMLAQFDDEIDRMIALLRTSAQAGNEQARSLVEQIDKFKEGEVEADELRKMLDELAQSQPDWAPAITALQGLVTGFNNARTAAGLLKDEMSGLSEIGISPEWTALLNFKYGERIDKDLGSMPEWNKPTTFGDFRSFAESGTKPKKTGSGKKADPYGDAVSSMQERIDNLVKETAVMASLNPLINDYGYAVEKARAQIELENAAKKAGLELGPEQQAQIAALAEGYATATAEAAQLAEAQGKIKEAYDELAQAGRAALDTLIDGFLEGKDAGEVLNNVVQDLLKSLVKMGINALTGGIGGGIMKVFGFAKGGIAANGRPQPLRQFAKGGVSRTAAIFGEAGPEAAVPLPDGRRIPVDLRMPAVPQAGPSAPQKLTVHVSMDSDLLTAVVRDEAGRVVATAAPTIVGASVVRANEGAPAAVQSRHARFG